MEYPFIDIAPAVILTGMVAPDRVLSMGQMFNKMCAKEWLMLNCDCHIAILETI